MAPGRRPANKMMATMWVVGGMLSIGEEEEERRPTKYGDFPGVNGFRISSVRSVREPEEAR